MGHDFPEAVDAGGDDGLPGGHRLEQHDAKTLIPGRRGAEDIAAGVVAGQLGCGDVAGHHHIIKLLASDEVAVPAAQRPVAHDDQAQLRILRLELSKGAQQIPKTLAILQPADEQQVAHAVTKLGVRRLVLEAAEVDPVGDDPIVTREVVPDELARRVGHRDSGVQLADISLE